MSSDNQWYEEIDTKYRSDEKVTSVSDVYFRVAAKNRTYSTEPYQILDLLGDMGGLLDIVYVIGLVLTSSLVKKAFDR